MWCKGSKNSKMAAHNLQSMNTYIPAGIQHNCKIPMTHPMFSRLINIMNLYPYYTWCDQESGIQVGGTQTGKVTYNNSDINRKLGTHIIKDNQWRSSNQRCALRAIQLERKTAQGKRCVLSCFLKVCIDVTEMGEEVQIVGSAELKPHKPNTVLGYWVYVH